MLYCIEMIGCINLQTMNCLIEKYLNLTGHVFIKVLSMKQVHIYKCFIEFSKLCIPNKRIVVQEDDKPWYYLELGEIQGKETG